MRTGSFPKPRLVRDAKPSDEVAQRIRRQAMAELLDLEECYGVSRGRDYLRAKKVRRYIEWLRAKAKVTE